MASLRSTLLAAVFLTLSGGATLAAAPTPPGDQAAALGPVKTPKMPMVGGAPMSPGRTIVENASQAKNLTTLVAAVKEAGLAERLSGKGPFTVFAPTNAAFKKFGRATGTDLMKPENQKKLSDILTYHVIAGDITRKDLNAAIKKGGGTASFTTVEGKPLTISRAKGKYVVTDALGHSVRVQKANVRQSNGAVYVISAVLQPS